MFRYICYNSDWIGWALGLQCFSHGSPPKMTPWDNLPSPPPRPAEIMEKIGKNKPKMAYSRNEMELSLMA